MAREVQLSRLDEITYITPRAFASVLFQHRGLVLWTFSLIFGASLAFALLQQPLYRSQMTILVNLERTDPVVTTDSTLVQRLVPAITDEQINSELQLLKSQDLLREVVTACGLQSVKDRSARAWLKRRVRALAGGKPAPENVKIARAVVKLQSDLTAELIPKSTLLKVSYASPDPELSAKVLNALSDLYLKKHLAVRRPAGTFDFFKQEAERSRRQLEDAEKALDTFTRESQVASVDAEREMTLKKLTEIEAARHDTHAGIEVMTQRIRTLQAQMAQVPPRLTTQLRKIPGRPPDQIQSTVLALELKRAELTGIFQPDYPAVKEVEKEISAAKAELAASQERAVVEETTDRDPTYEWLRAELEKARVDLVDLRSKEAATAATIAQLRRRAERLNELEVRQSGLVRTAKLAEATYLTYQKKEEEARISDALDRQRILNLAVADKPNVPLLPSTLPASIVLMVGLVCAVVLSGGLAFGAERIHPSFRTPRDVEQFLEIPVVAAIPERLK